MKYKAVCSRCGRMLKKLFCFHCNKRKGYEDDEFYEAYCESDYCKHGTPWLYSCSECNTEDDEIESKMGGIDKCLNCGKYQWGKLLNADQCCIKQCVNPNEY